MFKPFVKLMVLILVLVLAGPFFIRGPDGKPLIGLDDVRREFGDAGTTIAQGWNRLTARFRGDTDPLPVYRWQDEDGNWHFSDTANPDGASELFYVDPDNNVVPANDLPGAPDLPDGIQPLENINDLLDQAHDARQSMEQRNEQIEQRTDEQR